MITPLLNPIRTNGGTLYTFPSAQRDLVRVFTNDSYSFKFSHFACLNLKRFATQSNNSKIYTHLAKSEDYGFPDYVAQSGAGTTVGNKALAEHIQNYVFNFETLILNGGGDDDDYDNSVLRTPSERIFFNWLQKTGGIEFEYANRESNLYYEKCYDRNSGAELSYDPIDQEKHSNFVKNRVVTYIGNIDVMNSAEIFGDAFGEVYIHIPSTVGASYEVRFASVLDENYNGGDFSTPSEKIIGVSGSTAGTITSYGLKDDAIYDIESPTNTYTGDIGYIIDFRDSFYVNETMGYSDIMGMNEISPDDFEFNCILVYYDLTNKTTGETATNLYGVLFVDDVGSNNYIQTYAKHKTTNLQDGNSYGLKIELKVDAFPMTNVSNNTARNEELLDTLQEYIDDMTRLQQTIDIFNRQQSEISRLQTRVNELETILNDVDTLTNVESRVRSIETRIGSNSFDDQTAVVGLVEEIGNKVDDFINSQNNPSSITNGYGIDVVHEDNGNIIINSTIGSYSMNVLHEMGTGVLGSGNEITQNNSFGIHTNDPNGTLDIYTTLEKGSNLAILYVNGDFCTNDMHLYIDDTDNMWKVGQTFKLMIKDSIDFNGHDLYIHTGLDNGVWGQNIKIEGEYISERPAVEIICTSTVMNQTNDSFVFNCMNNGFDTIAGSSSISQEEMDELAMDAEEIQDVIDIVENN